jgi:hypothetical protein
VAALGCGGGPRRFRRRRDQRERDAVVGAHQLDRLLPLDGLEVLQILDMRVRGEVTHADDHLGDRRAVLLRPLAHAASDLVGAIERGLRGGTSLLDPLDRHEHLPLCGRPDPRDCSRSSTHTRAPSATAPWHSASAGSRCSPSRSRPRRQPASSIPDPDAHELSALSLAAESTPTDVTSHSRGPDSMACARRCSR